MINGWVLLWALGGWLIKHLQDFVHGVVLVELCCGVEIGCPTFLYMPNIVTILIGLPKDRSRAVCTTEKIILEPGD